MQWGEERRKIFQMRTTPAQSSEHFSNFFTSFCGFPMSTEVQVAATFTNIMGQVILPSSLFLTKVFPLISFFFSSSTTLLLCFTYNLKKFDNELLKCSIKIHIWLLKKKKSDPKKWYKILILVLFNYSTFWMFFFWHY